jgi:hypothetical protein
MPVLEERGLFWWSGEPIPEGHFAPEGSIAGLLTIDDDGRITLELDGYFPHEHGPRGLLTGQGVTLKRNIAGVLKTPSNRVLVIGVIANGGQVRSASMSYERFVATDCLVGDSSLHKAAGALLFNSLEVDLTGFDAWFWFRSINVSRSDGRIAAEWRRPESAVYQLDDETLTFDFDVVGSIPYGTLAEEIALRERASVRMSLTKKETLEQWRDRFRFFEEFLILLIDTEYRLKWPTLILDERTRARWYFSRFKGDETAEPPERHKCLTFFPHLRDRFGDIWINWREKREKFGPGFYLYLGTRRGLSLYAEHRFVNLIWGIEAFHRTKYPADAKAMKAMIDRIVDQVADKSDKKQVRWRFKYAHEPSLEERIYFAFKELPIRLDKKRLRSFAKACAKARNDISHFGSHRHGNPYSDFVLDLEKKSRALSTLYHCLLLYEIGIDEKALRKWIYDSFGSFQIKHSFVEVGLLDKGVLELPDTTESSGTGRPSGQSGSGVH